MGEAAAETGDAIAMKASEIAISSQARAPRGASQ
jgi:hypothetical protein